MNVLRCEMQCQVGEVDDGNDGGIRMQRGIGP